VTDSALPPPVQRFITAHIDSLEKLEVLLLLRARQERAWSAEAVSRELRITESSASKRLRDLDAGGLVASDAASPPGYRYSPARPEDEQDVAQVAEAYAERRVSVISFIFSRPLENVRGFADAFRLKRDKDDEHG
jgi:predicted ArsR family transcriptional regulator